MEDLMELYFSEKDVVKRHNLLKAIIFKCEFASKEFFEKALKKERKVRGKTDSIKRICFLCV